MRATKKHRHPDIDRLLADFLGGGDFAPLHAAARDLMARYLFTIHVPHAYIPDAVAAAVAKAYVHAPSQYDARRGRASTWLCTIARNEAFQIMRRAHARLVDSHADVSLVADVAAADGDGGASDEDYARLLSRVVEWMRRRPHEHREHLMRCDGMSYNQIAAAVGDTLNTVKTRIRRSRDKCTRAFGEDYARLRQIAEG